MPVPDAVVALLPLLAAIIWAWDRGSRDAEPSRAGTRWPQPPGRAWWGASAAWWLAIPYAFSSGMTFAGALTALMTYPSMYLSSQQSSTTWMSWAIILGGPIATLVAGGLAYWLLVRMLAVRDPGERAWSVSARGLSWLALSGLLLSLLSALGTLLFWLPLLARVGKAAWHPSLSVPVFGVCLSIVWVLSRGRSSGDRLAMVLLPRRAPTWSGWVIRAALAGAVGTGVEVVSNLVIPLTYARYWASASQSTRPDVSPMAMLAQSRSVRDLAVVLVALLVLGPALRRMAATGFSEWSWSFEQRLMARLAVMGLLTGVVSLGPIITQLWSGFPRPFSLSTMDLRRLSNLDMILIAVVGVATFGGVILLSIHLQRRRPESNDEPAPSAHMGRDTIPAPDFHKISRVDDRAHVEDLQDSGVSESPSVRDVGGSA